jgi:hypothetical protein
MRAGPMGTLRELNDPQATDTAGEPSTIPYLGRMKKEPRADFSKSDPNTLVGRLG